MSEPTPTTPEEIREEIEQTRAELGDTVDALTAKLDVKAQVKSSVQGKVSDVKASVADKTAVVTGAASNAATKAKQAVPAPVQNAFGQAGAKAAPLLDKASPLLDKASPLVDKASPLVDKARPYRKHIAAGVAALVAAAVLVLRRRSR